MQTKSTKSYRHCPEEEYEISIFICRGRQKAHYPKCLECDYRTTTEESPPIPVTKEKKKPQPALSQATTGSIMVKSEPPSATIFLDNDEIGFTPAIITQILPGKYKIKINMAGYNEWSQSVDVKANKETSLTAVLQGKDCSVEIKSMPTKAEISIDGNSAGITPITIDNVKTGKHLVEVKLDGYEIWSKEVNIGTEKKTSLTAELKTKYGSISLNSEPDKANIFLDGTKVGTTPAIIESVLHGTHLVEVRMDGYSVWEENVNVEPGKETILTASLQVNTGSVSIKSQPENAKIYLDAKHVGMTPDNITSINPGTHEIKVEMENYDVWTESVNIEAGKENAITVVLQRSTGSLMIESEPENAMIFVDGKEIGHTPEIIMSSAKGTHAIEVRLDGYDIWKKNVDIEPGVEKSLKAILQIKTGSLNINSKPSGGTIYLDGDETGTTPGSLKGLKLGTHQVEVKMDEYEVWSESVEISAERENKLTAVLQILTGSLNMKSEPTNATIFIDSKEVGNTTASIADLKPGKHLVEVKMDGYEAWKENVDIEHGKEASLTAELQQSTGTLDIKSKPANATIFIDGNEVSNTPAGIPGLKPGKHLVEVKMDGYENWRESVDIEHGKEASLTAELQQSTGALNIKSKPANATIFVDGNEVSNTPADIPGLKPGKHLVEVKMNGYENWSESVDIEHGKESSLTAVLQLKAGSFTINSVPTDAIVFIDGKEVGNTPADIADLKPGKHLIEIKMDGYEAWSESVNIMQGKAIALTATLQIKAGIVNITSEPSGAVIFIDGKKVGTTPVVVTDPSPGTHTIELKMDEFEIWSENVEIMPGKEVALAAVLQYKAGSICIKSVPSNALAFVEGEEIGKTPLSITNSRPGTYHVEVRMDGYEAWNKSVDVEQGKEITITADLQMKAGSISINSNPSEAIIRIDGKKSGKTPETITDMSPGTHLVEIIKDGYENWSESVDIKDDKENTLSAKLQKITGSINIKSNPPEATIYLDGEKIGTTPDTLKSVAIGTHEVEVKMEGFAEWKKSLNVKKGKEFTLNATLQLNTGSVSIESDPAAAVALLDGKDVGKTPMNLTGIKIGIYEVELQKEGYASCKKTIKIKAGKVYPLTAKLMEMTGSVNISSKPSNAIVCLDGKKIGKTPLIIADLAAGEYQLEVIMDGYEMWNDSVNINPGKESTVTAELQTKSGSVSIDSNPSNAIILIDNKEVGTTPKIITDLSHEKHLVEVKMDGYEAWSESINMEPGIELSVLAELQMIAGSVSISSEPSNAMILIDSKKAGATPKTLTGILPGEHHVEIRMEGYEAWSESVEIRSDKENAVIAVLNAITGSISVESNPSEATILLDGKEIGTTPYNIKSVAIGIHEIEVKKEEYAEWKKKLNVKKGKEITLNSILQPVTGAAFLESEPAGAVILIDGENVGKTPKVITGISPGKHEFEIRLEGYDPCLQTIKIKNGKKSLFSTTLQRKKGSLVLISNPSKAVIYIEGKKYGKTPGTITDLIPGEYTIELALDDYQTWSEKADIVPGEEITIETELQKMPGSISIESKPSEAKIFIDGNEVGTTPETINDIECGTHNVKLMMEGYGDWSENVEVMPDKLSSLTAVLQEMAGSISIKSEPPNATIFVDGNKVGATPSTVNDLSPDTHIVKISMDGYNVWSESVEINAKKNTDLTAILQEITGTINIESIPADALILLDGNEVGTTPETIPDIKIGAHLVEVRIDGYENWSENIEITDKEYNMTATLQELTGSIDIKSEPSNAAILVNGNKIGLTPETIKNIKPGLHQVEVRADGFENWSKNIEVTAENQSVVTALLQKASGSIIVTSTPEDAKIYINGEEVGITPATLSSIPIGTHEIEVKINGHENWKKSITIKKDKELTLNAVLQLNIGSINIESYPENAKIILDGKEAGRAPKRFTDIIVGTHEVEVLLDGYVSWKKTIKVKAEKEISLTADLKKVSTDLETETDKTTKPPEIPKPTTRETPDLKIESKKVKEKPIAPPQKSKSSSDKKKTKYSPEKLIKLRSVYDKVPCSQIESLPFITVNEKNNNIFFCHSSINHRYELKPIGDGDVVIDHTTELMWHQAGSEDYFNFRKANKWLKTINKKSYAGFNDWRLPTLEEASSLLEFGTKSGKFIHTIFDEKQWGTWTGDRSEKGLAWIVTYVNGTINQVQAGNPATFIRPVRSLNI